MDGQNIPCILHLQDIVSLGPLLCLQSENMGNKFVYTTEQSRVIGQEQLCPKIMKKVK